VCHVSSRASLQTTLVTILLPWFKVGLAFTLFAVHFVQELLHPPP